MNNREIMQAVSAGEQGDYTPQWLMAFKSVDLVKKLIPAKYYNGYAEYPENGQYGFGPMGE